MTFKAGPKRPRKTRPSRGKGRAKRRDKEWPNPLNIPPREVRPRSVRTERRDDGDSGDESPRAARIPSIPVSRDELLTRVLHRDALIIVINKPAGIPVHRGPKGGLNLEDLFDALQFGLPKPPALARGSTAHGWRRG